MTDRIYMNYNVFTRKDLKIYNKKCRIYAYTIWTGLHTKVENQRFPSNYYKL